jgi:HlyD family secretion protein
MTDILSTRIRVILLLSLLSGLLAACTLGFGPTGTPTPTAVATEASATFVQAEGRLVPHHYANLATAASGQVTDILVKEGDQVQSGTPLLQLGDREQYQADIASAELALINAQQELDDLEKNATLDLALARQALAFAQDERTSIADEYENLSEPVPQAVLEQTYANLVASEQRLRKTTENLEKYEKRHPFKNNDLERINLSNARSLAQIRYDDMLEKYNDMLNHPDPIELAQAQGNLARVEAQIAEHQRDVDLLGQGPDPDEVASATASLKAAQVALEAAQSALKNSEIIAPFAGQIADITIIQGEWVNANQVAIVLADFSQWEVQTDDLTELDVPAIQLGQAVTVRADALPEVELRGSVDAIKDLSEEKRGDVTYTVTILLDKGDPRLRWGMTVSINFE